MLKWFWGGGRTNRRDYWVGMAALNGVAWAIHPVLTDIVRTHPGLIAVATATMLTIQALVLWMAICICARRLHDIGRSGWWQLGPSAVALAGAAIAEPAWAEALGLSARTAMYAFWTGAALYLGFLVVLGLVRSKSLFTQLGPIFSD